MKEECNILDSICVLQNLVANYLTQPEMLGEELSELIKNSGGVKFIPYDAQANETAGTLITMSRESIAFTPKQSIAQSVYQSSHKVAITLIFTISAQSYFLAEKLGESLVRYLASISNAMNNYNLNISSLVLSKTQNNLDQSPNYFFNTITIGGSIPQVVWKIQSSDDILSTLKLNIKFDGQDVLSD